MTAPAPSGPVVVRVVGPPGSGKSLLIVAVTSALRRRGLRAGSVEARTGLDGAVVTVFTTGSGARVTLPGAIEAGTLAARAAILDPALDVLLAESVLEGGPAVEIVEEGAAPMTPAADLLAVIARERLARAFEASGPADDLGVAALIEERLLAGRAGTSETARVTRFTEAPIESARRLLDRSEAPVPPSEPRRRGWRRWLGR